MLTQYDDYPIHQLATTLDHAGSSDLRFFDRYWFIVYDVQGGSRWRSVSVSTRARRAISVKEYAMFLRLFGLSRLAFGLWLAVAPRKPGELWFGNADQPPSTAVLLRSVGARDIGLGLGLAADPRPTSTWLRVGILADLVDALAAVLVRDRIPTKNFATGFLGGLAYAIIGTVVAIRPRRNS